LILLYAAFIPLLKEYASEKDLKTINLFFSKNPAWETTKHWNKKTLY